MNNTDHLIDTFKNKAAKDGAFSIAFAICGLANTQRSTAAALGRLGNADASTPFGAIEALSGRAVKIADALNNISSIIFDASQKG